VSCAFLLFDICIAGTIQLFRAAVLIMESVKGRRFLSWVVGFKDDGGGSLNGREGEKIGCLSEGRFLLLPWVVQSWLGFPSLSFFSQLEGVEVSFVLSLIVFCLLAFRRLLFARESFYSVYFITYIYSLESLLPKILRCILCFVPCCHHVYNGDCNPILARMGVITNSNRYETGMNFLQITRGFRFLLFLSFCDDVVRRVRKWARQGVICRDGRGLRI
jgi:hypothetical protein